MKIAKRNKMKEWVKTRKVEIEEVRTCISRIM
jgi:hypothetical protein